jgi:hypothetical protein
VINAKLERVRSLPTFVVVPQALDDVVRLTFHHRQLPLRRV